MHFNLLRTYGVALVVMALAGRRNASTLPVGLRIGYRPP
jgi:hypothetical protein